MKNNSNLFYVVYLLLMVNFILACGEVNKESQPKSLEKVKLQIQWFGQAQFMGCYVALNKGFYKDEGLDVVIIPGGFNVNPVSRILNDNADIGIATGNQVLINRANKFRLKAFGTVFYKSIAVFMSKRSEAIFGPKDLISKTVGVFKGADTEHILKALLKKANIQEEKLKIVNAGPLQSFINDEMDLYPSYLINEPILMAEKNIPISLLYPDEFGIKFYSDTFFSSEKFYLNNRELIKKFLRATAKGWEYASREENMDETLDILFQNVKTLSKNSDYNHQKKMLIESIKYLKESDKDILFEMNRDRWFDMQTALQSIKVIENQSYVDSLCDFSLIREAMETE